MSTSAATIITDTAAATKYSITKVYYKGLHLFFFSRYLFSKFKNKSLKTDMLMSKVVKEAVYFDILLNLF